MTSPSKGILSSTNKASVEYDPLTGATPRDGTEAVKTKHF